MNSLARHIGPESYAGVGKHAGVATSRVPPDPAIELRNELRNGGELTSGFDAHNVVRTTEDF